MVLLFLCLDLAVELGVTSKQAPNPAKAVGVILSFPVFVYGLSSALVLAGAYLMDTWQGHPLVRNFTFRRLPPSIVEWIFFLFFLGLPLIAMAFSLFSKTPNWWEYTCLSWFCSVVAFYLTFWVNVVVYELFTVWELVKNHYRDNNNRDLSNLEILHRFILMRQISFYGGGRKTTSAIARGTIRDSEQTDDISKRWLVDGTETISLLPYSRVTRLLAKIGLFFQTTLPLSKRPETSEHTFVANGQVPRSTIKMKGDVSVGPTIVASSSSVSTTVSQRSELGW